jgi:uncharacterized protein with HEPN domain
MRDYSIYLKDIILNIDAARSFITNISYDQFIEDKKTNYSVVRCLEIIGEASKHIPATVRNKYPDVPWKAIAGTRNIIVHEYADVDLQEVWETVINDLAPLKRQIEKILSDR